jgi:hypothetical protein
MNHQVPGGKILNLNDWPLDPHFLNDIGFVDVNIHIKYIDIDSISQFEPKERKKRTTEDQKGKFDELIQTNLFDNYEIIGSSKKPREIRTRIAFSTLNNIESLAYVDHIFINKIDGFRKKRQKKQSAFYCVKMTVVIEVEGFENGLQQVEDRFVVIKANSHDDAYLKLEKKKDKYSEPYLNSDGRLVRWRIESFDDSYETDIKSASDLNNPNGVEVYSKFRSRRLTKDKTWNGKAG